MRVRFWGTRGSIPVPGPATVRYGGNTSCVEVRSASGVLMLLDCGTGARDFGQALLAEPGGPRRGHVFIGHTHWDHIQGLPFMAPLFVADYEWDLYGPRGLGPSLREALEGQMQYTYFPITVEQLAAQVRYHDLVEGGLSIGDVRISAYYMNHPALTLGTASKPTARPWSMPPTTNRIRRLWPAASNPRAVATNAATRPSLRAPTC